MAANPHTVPEGEGVPNNTILETNDTDNTAPAAAAAASGEENKNNDKDADAKGKGKGKRLLIFANGSRGDVQPIAALALALQRAGHLVRVLANKNHLDFLRSLDLNAGAVGYDAQAELQQSEDLRELMHRGSPKDGKKWFETQTSRMKELFPEDCAAQLREFDSFCPDIVFGSVLNMYETQCIAYTRGIPAVYLALMPTYWPSREFQLSAMRRTALFPHQTVGTIGSEIMFSFDYTVKHDILLKEVPGSEAFLAAKPREHMLGLFHPLCPVFIGTSPSVFPVPSDWSEDLKERVTMAGYWTLTEEQQRQQTSAFFGGLEHTKLEAFLGAGEKPVYMGWGSMIPSTPEEIVLLALRALRLTRMRGVILGGYADLSSSHLGDAPDAPLLQAYASQHVLFVKSAPHEWLFRRCSVIVHHGGAGTLAAAVRSGVPSVVTPCAFDQGDNGRICEVMKQGIQLKQFSKVTPEDLAAAITRCVTDQIIIRYAAVLGERVREEDAFEPCIQALQRFVEQELETGQFHSNLQARREELQEMRAHRRCCKGPRWLGQMCCSSSPNQYAAKQGRGKGSGS